MIFPNALTKLERFLVALFLSRWEAERIRLQNVAEMLFSDIARGYFERTRMLLAVKKDFIRLDRWMQTWQ